MALTKRQKQVLDCLVSFINQHGFSPSFEEIGRELELSSLASVHKHLQTLERKGYIRRGYNQSRSVEVIAVPGRVPFAKRERRPRRTESNRILGGALLAPELPLLGRIAAGQPVEAIPDPETISLGDLTSGKGQVFVLRVKGDSMVDDHICDGDYILVESARTARDGEIVVALIEGSDATLKRFFHEPRAKVRLQPANSRMDPIVLPANEVQIQGRVIGVLRKY
jgi:repressor LexA